MKLLACCCLLILVSCAAQQPQGPKETGSSQVVTSDKEEPVSVNYCELLQHPKKYEQKLIKIRAIYRYGFEWSELYSLKCSIHKAVWVEGTEAKCKNANRVDELDYAGWGSRTVGIVAVGRLIGTKGGYGHQNGYDYLFKIECLERAEMLDREGKIPQRMSKEQRRKVGAFENTN
jgi:hypothetical protein